MDQLGLLPGPSDTGTPPAPRRRASTVFWCIFWFDVALTGYWLVAVVTGRSSFFGHYIPTWDNALAVLDVLLVGTLGWGLLWFGVKSLLLAHVVKMSREDRRLAGSSRMRAPFHVEAMTQRYSERRIRIVDMISRRGRTLVLALGSFYYLFRHIELSPTPDFVSLFLGDQLLDAVVTGWVFLLVYRSDGWLGAAVYGSQARIMDGVLARANCLVSMTLWTLFKFVLVPIGIALSTHFDPGEFAVVFALIWGAYLVTDAAAEIGGSLLGKQTIPVRGLGDVNRKSVAGTLSGFTAGLIFSVGVVLASGLHGPWILLAVTIAASSTALELLSPRSTDDFTMATGNALICWAFGAFIL